MLVQQAEGREDIVDYMKAQRAHVSISLRTVLGLEKGTSMGAEQACDCTYTS